MVIITQDCNCTIEPRPEINLELRCVGSWAGPGCCWAPMFPSSSARHSTWSPRNVKMNIRSNNPNRHVKKEVCVLIYDPFLLAVCYCIVVGCRKYENQNIYSVVYHIARLHTMISRYHDIYATQSWFCTAGSSSACMGRAPRTKLAITCCRDTASPSVPSTADTCTT